MCKDKPDGPDCIGIVNDESQRLSVSWHTLRTPHETRLVILSITRFLAKSLSMSQYTSVRLSLMWCFSQEADTREELMAHKEDKVSVLNRKPKDYETVQFGQMFRTTRRTLKRDGIARDARNGGRKEM